MTSHSEAGGLTEGSRYQVGSLQKVVVDLMASRPQFM